MSFKFSLVIGLYGTHLYFPSVISSTDLVGSSPLANAYAISNIAFPWLLASFYTVPKISFDFNESNAGAVASTPTTGINLSPL